MTTKHWHVCATLAGYGPNGTIGDYLIATDPRDLVSLIHAELDRHIDHAHEMVSLLGQRGREFDGQGNETTAGYAYRDAYSWVELTGRLATLQHTFHPDRVNARVFQRDEEAVRETILKLVDRHMPCPIDPDGNELLYVWTCGETECREDS